MLLENATKDGSSVEQPLIIRRHVRRRDGVFVAQEVRQLSFGIRRLTLLLIGNGFQNGQWKTHGLQFLEVLLVEAEQGLLAITTMLSV